jgi:glycosyltransferase involved in cell wall biosynthesis
VHLLGKQDDIAQVVSVADLMLLPSEKESFGLVALEAMACGVPTIGSLAGGIPELVQHGVTGYLAPVGHTDEMAAYALDLLGDRKKYAAFREACLRRAGQEFSGEKISAQYEQIYYRVLGVHAEEPVPSCRG